MVAWTGRKLFPTDKIRAIFYQGPLHTFVADIPKRDCRRRFGRLCYRVEDPRDPTGFVWYAQARPLASGYGVPERWMTIDERGRWVDDHTRYYAGDYDPGEQELDWEAHGAEGDPGGELD